MQTDATSHNIVELNNVGSLWHLLALIAWCMQTNATTANIVGGHLKKRCSLVQLSLQYTRTDVFTRATFLWFHVKTGATLVALRSAGNRTIEMLVSNCTQQVPTSANIVVDPCKRTQHVGPNNVASVCTGLNIKDLDSASFFFFFFFFFFFKERKQQKKKKLHADNLASSISYYFFLCRHSNKY